VSTEPRAYSRLVAAALFLFLLLSDWVLLGGPLLIVRRALVAAVALVAVPYAIRHRRAVVSTLLAPPLVFFATFLAAGLALAPFAVAPGSAALHTLAFAGLTLFAVAVAGTVSLAATLTVVRLTLAIKLVGSLLLGLFGRHVAGSGIFGSAGVSLDQRHYFGGLFGNPNPLCDAAAAYLLLAICHLIERGRQWPTGRRGALEIAWYALTIPVSAYLMWQSLSRSAWIGLAIVALLLGLLAQWRKSRTGLSRRRRALLLGTGAIATVIATLLLLVWLNTSRGLVKPGGSSAENTWGHITSGAILDTAERLLFWKFAMARIQERPWAGYGMSLTPSIYTPLLRGPEHSHNLELEAALYAGIPAALLIVLFAASSLKAAAWAFLARRPLALSVAAVLFFFFLLAQVEPLIFGSPYPSLPIVLILAVHLGLPPEPDAQAH
jgi:O-antigen ligase